MSNDKARERAKGVIDELTSKWNSPGFLVQDARLIVESALLEFRKKGLEEAIEAVMDHSCKTWSECCDCRGDIAQAIRRLEE